MARRTTTRAWSLIAAGSLGALITSGVTVSCGTIYAEQLDEPCGEGPIGPPGPVGPRGPSGVPALTVAAHFSATGMFVNSGAMTIVNFGAMEIDTDDAVTIGNSWRFTVPEGKAGFYSVSVRVGMNAAWDENDHLQSDVYKNGALHRPLAFDRSFTGQESIVNHGTTIVSLDDGDFIDIRAHHGSVATASIVGNGGTWISIHRVGE